MAIRSPGIRETRREARLAPNPDIELVGNDDATLKALRSILDVGLRLARAHVALPCAPCARSACWDARSLNTPRPDPARVGLREVAASAAGKPAASFMLNV
jgi:hypothetical protein